MNVFGCEFRIVAAEVVHSWGAGKDVDEAADGEAHARMLGWPVRTSGSVVMRSSLGEGNPRRTARL